MFVVTHALIGYIFLLLTIRLLSRRPGAQMTMFEFVLIFLIGGIIILATAGDDHSITNGICAVSAIGLIHRIVAWLKQKFPRFGAVVDGPTLVLLKNGEWQKEAMHNMRLDDIDVMAAARTKGIKTLDQIKYAILERNGAISIIPKS